jgi:putative DNA primase/helicase
MSDRLLFEHDTKSPAVGDLVQWLIKGQDQFPEPKTIIAVSPDGAYVLVDDSPTWLPIYQIRVIGTGPPTPDKIDVYNGEARAWRDRSPELTDHVLKYLVNRTDIFGRYGKHGPFTAKDGLTWAKIDRHIRPVTPSDIIGLHSTLAIEAEGPDGQPIVNCTCRWVAVDIDHHGSGPSPPQNAEAAKHWHQKAAALGFRPLTYQSNGRGGYRLLIIFSEPIPAAHAYAFVRWLISDWRELGLTAEPEYFPRQKKIRPLNDPNDAKGACGNWLRLFGRHHSREHHSRFWDGQNVLFGDAAVDWVLDHRGDDSALIPPDVFTVEFSEPVGKVRESIRKNRPKSVSSQGVTEPIHETVPLRPSPWDVRVTAPGEAYARAALNRIVDEFSKQTEGHRHHYVVAQSNTLATMVNAGWISEEECLAGFRDAAIDNGMGEERFNEIDDAWQSAMERVDAHAPLGPSPNGQPAPSTPPTDWPTDPKPVRHELTPVPSLEPEMIPSPLRGWLTDIAERVGCALEFPVVGALAALGIVIGHKIVIRPKRHDDWSVTPNLWGAIVGRPGVLKSPALKEAIKPLRRLEAEAREAHAEAVKTFMVERDLAQAQLKAAKKELETAAKKKRPASELKTLAGTAAGVQIPDKPTLLRYSTSDATVEELGELLASNPNGIGVVRDELAGWLRSLEKQDQGPAKSFYLEAWEGTGASFQYDRIGRGHILIPNCVVTVLGGIQPGPLRAFLRWVVKGEEADDGLISRFQLLVWPDQAEWKNVDRWPDTLAKNRAFEVFKRLDTLDPVQAGAFPDADGGPPTMRFALPAQDLFDSWLHDLENNKLRTPDENPLIESHLGKFRKLQPALALHFHLVEVMDGQASGPVSLRAAELAVKWCDFLEAHARRIYSCVAEPDLESARGLSEKIRCGALSSPFQARDVYRRGWSGLDDPHAVRRAVGILQELGWLRITDVDQTGGAPREDVHIHPKLPRKPP